jgi:hypothetical protein
MKPEDKEYNTTGTEHFGLVITAVDFRAGTVDGNDDSFVLGRMLWRLVPPRRWLSPVFGSYHQGNAVR